MEKQEEIIVKREITIWTVIFHISMAILIIWVILKSIGVIQTPFWLEFGLPVSATIMGAFALYYDLIKGLTKVTVGLAVLSTRFNHLEKDVGRIDQKTDRIEADVSILKTDVSSLKVDVSLIKRKIKLS